MIAAVASSKSERASHDVGAGDHRSETLFGRLANGLESVVKLSGAFAAFGYIAFRAHLNFLGLSSGTSLGVDRYLMEVWALLATSVPMLLLFLLVGIVPVVWLARRRERAARTEPPRSRASGSGLTLLASTAVTAVALALAVALLWGETGVAVGRLELVRLQPPAAPWLFYLLAVAWFGCYVAYRSRLDGQPRHARPAVVTSSVQSWTAFGLTLGALMLPIAYGRVVHGREYPMAMITPKEGNRVCGALVLESEHAFELWQTAGGIGSILILPREGATVVLGPSKDLLAIARNSVRNPAAESLCPGV